MSASILKKIVILLAVVFFSVGLYFYNTTGLSYHTTIFLRTGGVFLLASCFWKWIIRLPSWAQIGWLPIVAAIIAWNPILLKFAIPISIVLVFLNSPLAKGSYKKKNWHDFSKSISGKTPSSSQSRLESKSNSNSETNQAWESSQALKSNRNSGPNPESELNRNSGPSPESESNRNSGPNPESESNRDSGPNPESESNRNSGPNPESESNRNSGPSPESESNRNSGPNPESESNPEMKHQTEVVITSEPESKPEEEKPLYGPSAQNSKFRALSRVAGRQVGKLINKTKKKK